MENYPPEVTVSIVPTPVTPTKALPGISALFKEAWNIYRQRWGVLVGITLIPSLLMFAFSTFDFSGALASWMIILVIAGVLAVVIQIWSQVALLAAIQGSDEGVGVRESYARGGKKFFSYLWICIILSFVLLGGFLLFIIPGIVMSGLFSLALFTLIAEDKRGMDALMRSRQLVRGNWWAVLGRIICVSLLVIIVSVILDLTGIEGLGDLVSGIILSPFVVVYMFLVYRHLKAAKDTNPSLEEGSKTKFVVIGILGLLLIPALIIFVFTSLETASRRALEASLDTDFQSLPY